MSLDTPMTAPALQIPSSRRRRPATPADIHLEQSYLSQSLARQSWAMHEAMRSLSDAEAELASLDLSAPGAARTRRRLRKRTSLLRGCVSHAARQQRALLARLGDLALEMHARQTWVCAQMEALAGRWYHYHAAAAAAATLTESAASSHAGSVSAGSSGHFSTPSASSMSSFACTEGYPEGYVEECVEQCVEECVEGQDEAWGCNRGLEYEFRNEGGLHRRASLPNLHMLW